MAYRSSDLRITFWHGEGRQAVGKYKYVDGQSAMCRSSAVVRNIRSNGSQKSTKMLGWLALLVEQES